MQADSAHTVLIVDDEMPVREMVGFLLRRAGFEVREAADCYGATEAIADRPPDLILMDWMLPGMSGLEITRRLKKHPATAGIPVIILTARGGEEDKALASGADDYLTKPFTIGELSARILAALRLGETNPEPVATARQVR